jgi:hypothetical protein
MGIVGENDLLAGSPLEPGAGTERVATGEQSRSDPVAGTV